VEEAATEAGRPYPGIDSGARAVDNGFA
jgi:hypothetical protein